MRNQDLVEGQKINMKAFSSFLQRSCMRNKQINRFIEKLFQNIEKDSKENLI